MNKLNMDIFEKFSCVGGSCPLTCCSGMNVEIDKKTFYGYQKLQSPFGLKVRSSIEKKGDRYFFKMKDNTCRLFNSEGLCDVYKNYGEAGFCQVCKTYPRIKDVKENYAEYCLCLSCPEVVRLLTEQEKIGFMYNSDNPEAQGIELPENEKYQVLFMLRSLLIDIAQESTLSLENRLRVIINLLNKLQPSMESNEYDEVLKVINSYMNPEMWIAMGNGLKDIKFPAEFRQVIYQQLTSYIHVFTTRAGNRYEDLKRALESFISDNTAKSFDEIIESALENEKFKNFWENYVVYYLFRNFIKEMMKPEQDVTKLITSMLVEYKANQLLIGIWSRSDNEKQESIVPEAIIASCARIFENGAGYDVFVEKFYKGPEFAKYPNIFALL